MNIIRYRLALIVMLIMYAANSSAQFDPTLTTMIAVYKNKAEKQLKSQQAAMGMETAGHMWVAEEMETTTEIQRLYNDYLDSSKDIVCYAGQIYGFYVEIEKLTKNMESLGKALDRHLEGAFATALSLRKNEIYRNLLLNSVEIVNDIRKSCMGETKMTEKQRIEIVFNIRPKLAKMNRDLRRLTLSVKYSSFAEIWADINQGNRPHPDKASIVKDCIEQWKRKGRLAF